MGIRLHCLVCTILNATVVMLKTAILFKWELYVSNINIMMCLKVRITVVKLVCTVHSASNKKYGVQCTEACSLGGALPHNGIISNNPEQFQPLIWMSCSSKMRQRSL